MILENKGIKTDTFYIPPFQLNAGEIVVIYLYNGEHFYSTEMLLKDIFCGNSRNENVAIYKDLTFVEHFKEPELRRLFYPITVAEYLKKNADLNSPYSTKIYEAEWINERTKVNSLSWKDRRLLSLYSTFSKTNNIIFDVVGHGLVETTKFYKTAKYEVEKGGSAILLDSFDDMKNKCTKYIELEWLK